MHDFFHEQIFPDWMIAQIAEDLSPYKECGISLNAIDQAVQEYIGVVPHNAHELVRCHIRNGVISIGQPFLTERTWGRWNVIYQALMNLSHIIALPDVNFVMCVGDSLDPRAALLFKKYGIPVLTFAKFKEDSVAILIPDFEVLSEGFYEKVLLDTSQGRVLFPWSVKEGKAFWRGATTGADNAGCYSLYVHNYQEFPRVKLAFFSAKYPCLIDAKLTALAQIGDARVFDFLAPYTGPVVSSINHLKYKYQILVDGNTCAYSRAYWQLFSDCLIFKQASPNIQWYYRCLCPYVHYVPVAYDFGDLNEKIEWAENHDTEVQEIIANANDFAKKNLRKQDVYLYLYLLLKKYADLQK